MHSCLSIYLFIKNTASAVYVDLLMLYCMLYNIIYRVNIEIKDTTDADHHASYLDLLLKYDNSHRLQVKLYDKRDDFDFDIVNFLFLRSNIPQSPGYGVFVLNLFGMHAPPLCMTSDFIM